MKTIIKVLLVCGIIATLLYISTDFIASQLYNGYSYVNQTISELSAIGAPTRAFWTAMIFIFNPLLTLFGIGVFLSAKKKSLKVAGILIAVWGITGFIWLLFPMNIRGNIGSASDTGHLIMAGVTVALMTTFIGFGIFARKTKFKIYSILTILVMLAFGAFVGTKAPQVAANLPTPGLGILERISVFAPMIWISVLAVVLLRDKKGDSK